MLVHIVNQANRSLYAEYLHEMFKMRREIFVEQLGWKDLKIVDGKEVDEADDIAEVEYLLTIDANGALIGSCRCNPTLRPHLLSGALKEYAQREYEIGAHVWEFTRLAPTRYASFDKKLLAHAYMSAGIIEWALSKNVTKLLGVAEDSTIALSGRMGWKMRLLGMPIEYDIGKRAVAIEYEVNRETLAATRIFYNSTTPVTYMAPPPMDYNVVSAGQIAFLDYAIPASLAYESKAQMVS